MFGNEYITMTSVKAVEDFLNRQVPLSQTIADTAKKDRLNSDQIKRLVEATNQITHLKLLQIQSDRTAEFPVASYEEVMKLLAPVVKQASAENLTNNQPFVIKEKYPQYRVNDTEETNLGPKEYPAYSIVKRDLPVEGKVEFEKAAAEIVSGMSEDERLSLLWTENIRQKGEFEKTAEARCLILADIERRLMQIRADKQALEKVAMVCQGDSEALFNLSGLLLGAEDFTKVASAMAANEVFTEAEIRDVKDLHYLYKQAKIITEKYASLQDSITKVDGLFEMRKEAMLRGSGPRMPNPPRRGMVESALTSPIAGAAKIVGRTAQAGGRASVGLAKTIGKSIANPNSLGSAVLSSSLLVKDPAHDVWANLHPHG